MASLETLLEALRQWLQNPLVVQVFAVVFSTALASFASHKVFAAMGRRAEASSNLWDDAFLRTVSKPAQWLIWVVGISFAAELNCRTPEPGSARSDRDGALSRDDFVGGAVRHSNGERD